MSVTLEEYLEICKKVEEEAQWERVNFPETICNCDHSVDCHSYIVDHDPANDVYYSRHHVCMKCDCEGFWRND
jgi:hypothetical protein